MGWKESVSLYNAMLQSSLSPSLCTVLHIYCWAVR
jgi:hypothetical protein